MLYFTPIMILFIGVGLPSAIAIYWVVTNAFTVLQTLIFNNPFKINAERAAKRQAEKTVNVIYVVNYAIKLVVRKSNRTRKDKLYVKS